MRSTGSFLDLFSLLLFISAVTVSAGFTFPKPHFKVLEKFRNSFERNARGQVHRMEVEVQDTVSYFLSGQTRKSSPVSKHFSNTNRKNLSGRRLVGDTFKWSSCGPKDQLVDIHTLTLKPQPLEFPGTIELGFDVELKSSIPDSSDLSAKINLDFQQGAGAWTHIPCLGNIGSCEYTDLCGMSKMITACPENFVQAGIPCKCPFPQGDFKLNEMSIEIDASVFLPGNYRGNVTLSKTSGQLACYKVSFVVS